MCVDSCIKKGTDCMCDGAINPVEKQKMLEHLIEAGKGASGVCCECPMLKKCDGAIGKGNCPCEMDLDDAKSERRVVQFAVDSKGVFVLYDDGALFQGCLTVIADGKDVDFTWSRVPLPSLD